MKRIGAAILLFVLTINAIDVKFCSKSNFEGSCATKEYDLGKCEHLPGRFRLLYDVGSVKIKSGFFGRCNSKAHCVLHTSKNCTQPLMSPVLSTPFNCGQPILSVIPGLNYKAVLCYKL